MSAKKRIVIQHTDGKFYEFYVYDEDEFDQWLINLLKYPDYPLAPNLYESPSLDFLIGSRVYFQGIGWTEVCDEIDEYEGCNGCALDLSGECTIECHKRIFKKLEIGQFYILNTKTSHTSVIHTTEESARKEAERLSKKQPGDVFKVLKVVASCQSEAIIKWSEVK